MPAPIVSALADLFPDVVIAQPGTTDGAGTFTAVGAAISCPALVSGRIEIVKDEAGQERVSTVNAILAGVYGVNAATFRFTLPARFVPNTPIAIAVKHATDENGAHHERVYF